MIKHRYFHEGYELIRDAINNSDECRYQLLLEFAKNDKCLLEFPDCACNKCCFCKDTKECYSKRIHYFNRNIDIYNYDDVVKLKGFVSNSTRIKLICHKCNHTWETTWKSARMGQFKCHCKMSKGEKIHIIFIGFARN